VARGQGDPWSIEYMLLYFLHLGYSHNAATVAVKQFCDEFPDRVKERNELYRKNGTKRPLEDSDRPVTLVDFFTWGRVDEEKGETRYGSSCLPLFPPSRLKLKGNLE
jgi:hypothetical protein